MNAAASLLVVHVTPGAYRDLPARLHPDDLAIMSLSACLSIDMLKESLTTLVEEAALRCSHLDGREIIATIDSMLTDLAGDVGGGLSNAAEAERDELYEGISARGPMHRVRR